MTYYNAFFCIHCKRELSSSEKMYSQGRCPRCGFRDLHAGTVVKTFARGYWEQKVCDVNKKWWQFWIRPRYMRIFDAPGDKDKPVPRLAPGDVCVPGFEAPEGFGPND